MQNAMYFEDFYVGLIMTSKPYHVSKDEIVAFASKWDPQPFHLDEEAAKNSVFGRISACSAHIFAIASGMAPELTGDTVPQVIAGLGFDKLRMIKPLYAGDDVYLKDKVVMARRSASKPDRGIVKTYEQLINQHEEVVFEQETVFLMEVRPD